MGICIALLLLVLFIFTTDISLIATTFKEIDLIYILPAVLSYLVSLWMRSFRWKYLLIINSEINTFSLFRVVCVGYMANNLLPFRIGEIIRSYYLSRKSGIPIGSGLSSILLEHLLDAMTLLFLIIIAGPFVPLTETLRDIANLFSIRYEILILVCTLPFISAMAVTILITYFHHTSRKIVSSLISHFPHEMNIKIRNISDDVINGLMSLRSWRSNKVVISTSIPIWILEAISFHCIGLSLRLEDLFSSQFEMFAANIFMTGITNIVASIPASPGGTGIFEFVARETLLILTGYKVTRAVGSVFAITLHACLMLPPIVLGQIFLLREGLTFYKLYKSKPTNKKRSTLKRPAI